ncbi:hypothetical protein [Sinomonas sp.]|uniref:hypothetical protein n=1 Tax=Sinomonas sp. TaxID=1914986 RepID=UPI002FE286F4
MDGTGPDGATLEAGADAGDVVVDGSDDVAEPAAGAVWPWARGSSGWALPADPADCGAPDRAGTGVGRSSTQAS